MAADSTKAIPRIVSTRNVPHISGFLPIASKELLARVHSPIHTHKPANPIANHAQII